MFGDFNRQSGDSPEPEQANWQGWTPPWMSGEGEGPRGPFGPGRGFGGPRGPLAPGAALAAAHVVGVGAAHAATSAPALDLAAITVDTAIMAPTVTTGAFPTSFWLCAPRPPK